MTVMSETEKARIEAFFERASVAQAPAWRPNEGDVLTGPIMGFRKGEDAEYGSYPILVIETENGPVSFHGFHTLVRDRLKEIKPAKGDIFTVMYGGKRIPTIEEAEKGKREYHVYYIEGGNADVSPVMESLDFDF